MAEETQAFQNKKLLIIAIVLAIVVVVIYNVHIQAVKDQLSGQKTKLVRYTHDMLPGAKIKDKDLEPVDVPKDTQSALGDIVKYESRDKIIDKEMLQKVDAKQLAMHWHYQKNPEREVVGKEEVAITVDLSPTGSIGNVLRVGDRVNLVGFFAIGAAQQAQACRIIGGVRVIAIGGKGESVKKTSSDDGQTGYRQLTIAVMRSGKDDIALQLRNVLTHAIGGGIMVELSGDPTRETGFINPQLSNMKDRAAVRASN